VHTGIELQPTKFDPRTEVWVEDGKSTPLKDRWDYVVMAVPPKALNRLVREGAPDHRIVDSEPGLAKVNRLGSQAVPILHLCFTKKLKGIPDGPVGLFGSELNLAFTDSVVGGAVPKNYIPAVGEGVMEYLKHGPLGCPEVDVTVNLSTGQFHAVDSSDQAFKTAGRMAMSEIMPKCEPILLEPIHSVELSVPNAFTAKVQRLVSGRRGQILGFDAKPDWPGWDVVTAYMPHSELHDLIVELRSITLGVGTYADQFDHLQELTGRLAERVLAEHGVQAAQ